MVHAERARSAGPVRRCSCGRAMVAGGQCESCRARRKGTERLAPPAHQPRSNGRPPDPPVRTRFEQALGHDFGSVRVHADGAAGAARGAGAIGRDDVFGGGRYDFPMSSMTVREPPTRRPPAGAALPARALPRCRCGGLIGPTGECERCRAASRRAGAAAEAPRHALGANVQAPLHPFGRVHVRAAGERRPLMQGAVVQAKLVLSHPRDALELEADALAERVLRDDPTSHGRPDAALSRAPAPASGKGAAVARMRAAGPIDTLRAAEPKVRAVTGGSPLPPRERSFFEARFGVDFSAVRIHTDSAADAAARTLGALAYARGAQIVFRSGAYAPDTLAGRRLLAHELAHVVQRRAAASGTAHLRDDDPVARAVDEDAKETVPADAFPPSPARASVGAVSSEEAERVGREALASIGYEEIVRRAMAAGLLKPAGAPEAPSEPGRGAETIRRQEFGAVFTRYAVAAGVASQVDSPVPGPGDVVAVGILVVGLFAALHASTRTTTTTLLRPCPPCPSPPPAEVDRVPPSTPHFPCPGDHWHYYVYNQNPVSCQCFGPRRLFGGCCGLGGPSAPC